jgi:predicted permease
VEHHLLREAARSLARDRRFAVLAATLLAVTLGTLTAVYALVHAVVLRPFPFADQDRLVIVWQRDDRRALPVIEVAHDEMADWRARSHSVEDLAVVGSVNWSLSFVGANESETADLAAVSASFFPVVGVVPSLGHAFTPADEQGALPQVMVISHGLWLRRFGGDPSIVGRPVPVKLDAEGSPVPVVVLGVMPHAFDFPRDADVWMPAAPLIRKFGAASGGAEGALRWLRVFYVLGRLRSHVPLDTAARELSDVMRTTETKAGPQPNAELVVTPLATYVLGPAQPVLWTLLGGAALMLAIACANVAGLQLSRAARQERALAIRAALGASSGRLIVQTLLESALLTAAALAGAALVTLLIVRGLVVLAPAGVPRLDTVVLVHPPVLLFAAGAAILTIVVCGLWPGLVAGRLEPARALAHGPGRTMDQRGRRLHRIVVSAQVAVALTLLVGTALFVRTLNGLDRTTLGFDPNQLLAISVTPPTDDTDRWNAFFDVLIERVESLPGVVSAGAVALRPLSGPIGWDSQPLLPGQVPAKPTTWELNPNTNLEVITPSYFRVMGTRLIRGRFFSAQDTRTSPGVVVVSETAARRLWPGRDAVGQRLRDPAYRSDTLPAAAAGWQTVVGVVEDVRYRGLNDVRLDLYLPSTQSTNRVQHLMVRSEGDPAAVVASIRAAARALNANAAVSDATIMSEVVMAESAPWRFLMQVFVSFAALAGALAAVGLAGVVALSVSARRRELAIRAALGADRARLRRVVFREGLLLVLAGTVAGLLLAIALGRSAAHLLVGVAPHDPLALGIAASVAAATGLVASWLPARRAADANPIEALRAE